MTRRPHDLFEIARLRRRELVVEDDERGVGRVARDGERLGLAAADERGRIGRRRAPARRAARPRRRPRAPVPRVRRARCRDRPARCARVTRPTSAARSSGGSFDTARRTLMLCSDSSTRSHGDRALADERRRARRARRRSSTARRRASGRRRSRARADRRRSRRVPSASRAGGCAAAIRARRGDRARRTPRPARAPPDASGTRIATVPAAAVHRGADRRRRVEDERQRPGPERRGQPRGRAAERAAQRLDLRGRRRDQRQRRARAGALSARTAPRTAASDDGSTARP